MTKIVDFIKKFWKLIVAVLLILIVIITVFAIIGKVKANKVEEYLNGKTFVSRNTIYDTYNAYSFKDGKIALEEGLSSGPSGNIYEFAYDYKVKASLFTNEMWVMTKYPHGYIRTVAVALENGIVKTYKRTDSTPDWEITTPEKVGEIARMIYCQHNFSEWNVLIKPTTSTDGKRERQCSICGKQESDSFNYTDWIVSYIPTIDEFTEILLDITNFKIAEQSETVTTYTNTGSLTDYSYIIAKTKTNVTYVCNGRGQTISYDTSLYDNPSLSVILKGTTSYHLDAWVDYFLGDYPNKRTASYILRKEGNHINAKTTTLDKTIDGVHYSINHKITTDSGLGTVSANITIP